MIVEQKKLLRWLTFPATDQLRPSLINVYQQCNQRRRLWTHVCQPFTTYLIDLRLPECTLLTNYSKKLRQNIRRAKNAGIRIERDQDPTEVIRLFKPTIRAKGLRRLGQQDFATKTDLLITRAVHPQMGVLAAHAYQLDWATKTVKGVYNASAFRLYPDDKVAQYACGQANSLLYHEDFCSFGHQGFVTYDFGGYGGEAPQVDYFKDRFAGQVAQQYNYYPLWYFCVRWWRSQWKKWTHGQ
ncbi:MAG: hypothetical protein DA408_11265 [Bacteroidetes bacterium]|nr:MAG: hypothetical protein C7N36_14160 [Bacteroidota bacterium]PTM12254.1 MAG: hypothetical protein DA408_11265 [Bacteroidota bacterium]